MKRWAMMMLAAVNALVMGAPLAIAQEDNPWMVRARVLGVSKDSLKSHNNFRAKQGFDFDLASDVDETICNAFGVIQPKKLYGREYVGIVRSTYLVDPEGVIRQSWQPVKVPGHAQAVLDALKALKRQ